MTKFITIICLSQLCLGPSCKKSGNGTNAFTGTWELIKHSGYPFNNPTYPPGNGNLLVINKNGSFEFKQHDTVQSSGHYDLRLKQDCYPREGNILMTFYRTDYNYSLYVSIHDGELWLDTPNCYQDGGT